MVVDISVVVPVYKTGKYLRDCVDSIIAQTVFDRMEIILVDDGSPDNASEICDDYAAQYKNIFSFHQENAGVSAARNAGIAKTKGKYIGFVDSDDAIFPEMYERLFETAENTQADLSVCGLISEYPDKKVEITYPFPESCKIKKEDVINIVYPFMLRDESFNSCCNKIFSKEIIANVPLVFAPGKKHGEDREFVVRFLAHAKTLSYINYPGYFYRMAPFSAVQSARLDYAESILSQYNLDFELFEMIGLKHYEIEKINSIKLMEQVAGALSFAFAKQKGKTRRRVMNSIIMNAEIRKIMKLYRQELLKKSSRFNRAIYFFCRNKSVFGLNAVFFAMKLKLFVFKTANGGTDNGKKP